VEEAPINFLLNKGASYSVLWNPGLLYPESVYQKSLLTNTSLSLSVVTGMVSFSHVPS
jgi:hypothetical protein